VLLLSRRRARRRRGRRRVLRRHTLFCGGPGATGRSHSDFPTIIRSIRSRLLTLPPETIVHTGHGESTTIGDEAPHLEEWLARGH
jgi:glyoxylase-like metal-dependent hydrolase (beta-lactamase superfamily II)